jgi:DNA-binding transcriptional LysR family regulator
MRPDPTSLALFVRIAETRSITKAAHACHIALAAASRRVTQLEDQFNVQLLYRTARGVDLTPAGTALLQHARIVLSQMDEMQGDITGYAEGAKGTVRIQANASALAQYLPDDLATFAAAHPAIKVSLGEERSGAIVQAVQSGAADVGIVMEGADATGLECLDYRADTLCVVLPRKHPLKARSAAFSQLLDEDFVGLESNTVISQFMLEEASRAGKPLKLRVQVKSFDVVAKMIQAGLGVGILPEAAARSFAAPMGLRLVKLTDAGATRKMYVCIRNRAALPAPARMLVEHLAGKKA